MEEKLTSRALAVSCGFLSSLAGATGAFGVMDQGAGFLSVPERHMVNGLFGGAILGFGVGFTAVKMMPDDPEWKAWRGVAVLQALSAVISSGVGAGFYVGCRIFGL